MFLPKYSKRAVSIDNCQRLVPKLLLILVVRSLGSSADMNDPQQTSVCRP